MRSLALFLLIYFLCYHIYNYKNYVDKKTNYEKIIKYIPIDDEFINQQYKFDNNSYYNKLQNAPIIYN